MNPIFFYARSLLGQFRHLGISFIEITAFLQILCIYNMSFLGSFCAHMWSPRQSWTTTSFLRFFHIHKALNFFFLRNLLASICKLCHWKNEGTKESRFTKQIIVKPKCRTSEPLLSISVCSLWSHRAFQTKWSIPIFIIQNTSFSKFKVSLIYLFVSENCLWKQSLTMTKIENM